MFLPFNRIHSHLFRFSNIPNCISPYHVYHYRDIYIALFHLLGVKIAIFLKCAESRKVLESNHLQPFPYCINILVTGFRF